MGGDPLAKLEKDVSWFRSSRPEKYRHIKMNLFLFSLSDFSASYRLSQ
jgi:hypothetical protein